ncbi:MAG: 4-hydroxy-tetrahydrodipicolinate synthase [Clostridia bacterium]|nr:4-hydroxy-tetrahydrodipicolinate synthase [Clostridia bacterium]
MAYIFQGVGTALITPMIDDCIDYISLEKLVKTQIISGIDCLIANGTTGEPSTISDEEKIKIASIVIEVVDKKIPVIVGAGSNSTAHAIKLAKDANYIGADGILCVTPYYNKCTQQGLVEHFKAIADQVDLPMIMYNVPSRTGLNMLPETVAKLAGYKGICAIKEASGNISQIMELATISRDDFNLYSGDDGLTYPILTLGGAGVISVASNIIPQYMCEMVDSYFTGNIKKSRDMQLKILPLIKALFFEVNPIPVKCAAKLLGICGDEVRLPLTKCTCENLLKKELMNIGLL